MIPEFARLDAQYVEYFRENGRWQQGTEALDRDGLLRIAGTLPFAGAVNVAARLDPTLSPAEVLARAREFFHARERGFSLYIRGEPDRDLEEHAQAEGLFAVGEGDPWMLLRQRPAPASSVSGIRLEPVTDAGGLEAVRIVSREAYAPSGLPHEVTDSLFAIESAVLAPHNHFVVAWEGDTPLAAAMCHLHEGVAGIHWVGTRDAARRRGLGTLCTYAVVHWGFDRGADISALQASEMGLPIYEAMGFETFSRTRLFIAAAPAR
jgi:GNAT superfamily N-acetyltransferase